jgi:hypothetical protein
MLGLRIYLNFWIQTRKRRQQWNSGTQLIAHWKVEDIPSLERLSAIEIYRGINCLNDMLPNNQNLFVFLI